MRAGWKRRGCGGGAAEAAAGDWERVLYKLPLFPLEPRLLYLATFGGSGAADSLKNAGIFWTLLMMLSFLFLQAADTVLKGGLVDIFVVNSFGSAFQALFTCLLLPFLSKLWGVPFSQLPKYVRDGAACFLNIGSL